MEISSPLHTLVCALPKAELHVHLEGSIQPATLLLLARRNGVHLPVQTVAEVGQWFNYRDFAHFVEVYVTITRCLRTAEDYELITYEFGAGMARQNVRYAEVTFSPSTHYYALAVPHDTYFTGLTRGRERVRRDFGVEIRWVFDIVRNIEGEERNRTWAEYTLSVALESAQDGVVALGLGGAEVGYPPERFARWFDRARAAGLHSTPHSGETEGPASIWKAVRLLGAERLGHGVRAIEDQSLVEYLADRRIPLEICPRSNISLGVYPSLAEHPLPQLHEAGIPLTIGSDDPALFNTTLNQEIELLVSHFGFDLGTTNELVLNGVRFAFLPLEEKRTLEALFRAEMARLLPA